MSPALTPVKPDAQVKLETKFGVACCELLAKYPLYAFREPDGKGKYRLRVLLVGSTADGRLKDLMHEILANGQLLHTDLHVTVVSETAEQDGRKLHGSAPDLHRFIHILGVPAGDPHEFDTEWDLGTLEFVTGGTETAAKLAHQYHYVFIGTGDAEQDGHLAQTLTPAPGGVLAYSEADSIHVRKPDAVTLSGGVKDKNAYLAQIDAIAHNLHFIYEKSQDVRETRAAIRSAYSGNLYDRLSDLEAALHVRSKLACCGILEEDPQKAAAAFAEKIRDPKLLDALAELEHRRWCVSKMLNGYYCPADVSGIYQNGNETHSRDKSDKWHTILVRYSGGRLDLDGQTRRIQARCAQLTEENREPVQELLDQLQMLVMSRADALRDSLESFETLRWTVEQLWAGKRSVIPTYKRHKRALDKVAQAHKTDIPALEKLLSDLSLPVDAQIECVSEKDYKKINEVMVQQIPFALTHKMECVLVKLLADRDLECLFSPWRLEPTTVHYVDLAESQTELQAAANRAERLNNFLKHNNNGINRRYHILHPAGVCLDRSEVGRMFGKNGLHLHPVPAGKTIGEVLSGVLDAAKPDYIDLTGGNPMLTCATRQYAGEKGTGAFYVRGGMLRDVVNAAELEYRGPEMDITVQEMFDKAGAELIKTDSRKMSDGADYYRTFWDIALLHRNHWDSFCRQVALGYRRNKDQKFSLTRPNRSGAVESMTVCVPAPAMKPLIPILLQLCGQRYLESCDTRQKDDGSYEVTFRIRSKAEGELFRDILRKLAAEHREWTAYDLVFTEKKKDPRLTCYSLQVEQMDLPADRKDSFVDFLKAMEKAELIFDLRYDDSHGSFRAASADVRDLLRNSGKVLEAYIYYSAMLDGRFDDVEMSVFFHHSNKKSAAKNEVDVICTRGIASLFISAKNVRNDHIDSTFLNHVCYEVSVLADQFGINAKRVLVAPDVKHNVGDKEKDKVAHALGRNVYLVGKELCQGDRLGEVLKKIAAGDDDWNKV